MNQPTFSDREQIASHLDPLRLGGWQYFEEIGSTNDAALKWADEGASDWSLVMADLQTKGRGRGNRRWITRPGTALALSLILRPTEEETPHITRFTALGALGVVHALKGIGLQAVLKWPNDVLLAGRKVAGVLVEGDWQGENPLAVVIGIGVNIKKEAVPDPELVRYPATSIETVCGHGVDRWEILADIIRSMQNLRPILTEEKFMVGWNQHLAFRGEWVMFKPECKPAEWVRVEGVTDEGGLSLTKKNGVRVEAVVGEIDINKEE